ncbi:MAG: radical SAM protein [Planctomycetes bacterium]|nr:radical SAM protein [Planctomycetota bacterium]
MKTFLIAPPVGNFGQATPGISVLTAWLRYKGYPCVQWDLSIDAFHHFHSQEYLRQCAKVLAERAKVSIGAAIEGAEGMTRGPGVLNPPRPGEREETVLELALRTAPKIEAAKIRIREAGVESNAVDMKRCVETIRDAGLVVGATHGCFFGYNRYDVPGAFASWERMLEVATTADQNPFLPYFQEQVLPRIAAEAPELLGLSVTYMSQWLPALTLAHLVRKAHPSMRIVMGGSFPASVQEDVVAMPTAVGAVDGIIFGDGEEPLSRYLQAMAGEIGFEAVPGLLRADGDRYVMNAEESKVKLDEIPPPVLDLDGIELDRYLVPKYSVALPATRGCYWGKCTFCNISNQARYRYRRRSNVRAVEDMQILKERYGTNWFDFAVDSYPPADLLRLSRAILEAGLEVEWGAEVLLDKGFTRETLEEMARAGCRTLRFGLESADPDVLRDMSKRVDPPVAARILADCRAAGIKTSVMCIVGFPTETQSRMMRTIEFLIENAANIDFVTLHQFGVVPGTPLADEPDRFGIRLLPKPGVLNPSLPYQNLNAVSMLPQDLPKVIDILIERLREAYPNVGELWTSAIGGWLTFPAACANTPEFFKTPVEMTNA